MKEQSKDFLSWTIIIIIVVCGYMLLAFIKKSEMLEREVAQMQSIVTDVEESNKELKEAITIKEQSIEIAGEIIKENNEIKEEQKIKQENIENKTRALVKETKRVTKAKIDNETDPVKISILEAEEAKTISNIRITALWVSYCTNEPDSEECKEIKS